MGLSIMGKGSIGKLVTSVGRRAAPLALLRPRGARGLLCPSVCFYFCNAVAWVVHSKGIVGLWGCPDRCNNSGSLGILGVDRLGFHLCTVCHGCWSSPPFDSLAVPAFHL
ncbi:hypothetical protein SDJN03_01569, partial [Cucurbita argyrosperma subsp. sororia]